MIQRSLLTAILVGAVAMGAIGCSEGILDRVENQNWSSFHQGIREVLMKEGMGELMTPGTTPGQ